MKFDLFFSLKALHWLTIPPPKLTCLKHAGEVRHKTFESSGTLLLKNPHITNHKIFSHNSQ